MEELFKIPYSEKVVDTTSFFYRTRNIDDAKKYMIWNNYEQKEIYNIMKFLDGVSKIKEKYRDLHTGNIMQDKKGNIKFIDFESFFL